MQRQIEELQERLERVPSGTGGGEHALNSLFELFRGPLFAAIVEVSLAARTELLLHQVLLDGSVRAGGPAVTDENFERSWA